METLALVVLKILWFAVVLIALNMVLELSLTGNVTLNAASFLSQIVSQVLNIPMQILSFLACVMFQIIDFIIEILWDMIPGLSDVFSAPSASDLFNAC